MRIFIPADYYLPAFKAGGPIRTVSNIVSLLGKEIDFVLITRKFDIDGTPIHSSAEKEWETVGNASVNYLSKDQLYIFNIMKIIRKTEYDVLYFNSFFSLLFTVIPLALRRFGLVPKNPAIIAPRGEFTTSALGIKKWKKRIYLTIAKNMGLFTDVIWQASSIFEEKEIKKVMGDDVDVVVANDLIMPMEDLPMKQDPKKKGELRIIFLSRISKMKNLVGALNILKNIHEGSIIFDIYGPIEDPVYWEECKSIINQLPSNITVNYKGEVPSEKVHSVMGQHDLFFLPTFGEGFGHVIIEALSSGCPVLISDRTPWRNLEQDKVGWEISLEKPEEFETKIKCCLNMSQEEHMELSKQARIYSSNLSNDIKSIEQHRLLFDRAAALQK